MFLVACNISNVLNPISRHTLVDDAIDALTKEKRNWKIPVAYKEAYHVYQTDESGVEYVIKDTVSNSLKSEKLIKLT